MRAEPDVDAAEVERLTQLTLRYMTQGAYADAEPICQRLLQIHEDAFGAEHPDTVGWLSTLAALYQLRGMYAQAEPLFERVLHIREIALGAEHPYVVHSLSNLAGLYEARGAYAQAEPLYERVLRVYETALGGEHPETARPLSSLAGVYKAQGAYARAEPLYERALRIRENALGAEHPDVATSLNNLAMLYLAQAAYARAEPLYERALRIREATQGTEHADVATALNNLAELYRANGAYARAEPLYERALRIHELALDAAHPTVATLLNNLAKLHAAQGAYSRARPLCQRALAICETARSPEHPEVAESLNILAGLYHDQGAYAQAEPLYERVLRIFETALEAGHPDAAVSLNNLALVCWCTNDVSRALRHFVRAAEQQERHLGTTLAALPERRKRQLLQTAVLAGEVLVSFHAHAAPDDVDALALALTATLQRKGRVLAELVGDRRGKRARQVEHAPVTIEAVQAALPSDATLVELVRYQRYEPHPTPTWREDRYIAYLLRREGPPRWIALGSAEPINAAVTAALAGLARPGNDVHGLLRAVDELVLAPIRRMLGPTRHWVLSPDAALHLVPFAALVDEDGRYLIEQALVSYVTSGRDLVRSVAEDVAQSKPLVIAAPAYEGRCAPLPGAEAEAEAIRTHFADLELHVGPMATKEKLTAARGPWFVHVATHGFFRRSDASPPGGTRSWRDARDVVGIASSFSLPSRPNIEDALDDAGLMFAGASETEAMLTAREIAAIDLRGTQLIVLSACVTGVGELDRSEGVYGLRRALAIAGAQTQVVSLWKIDDGVTSTLMDRYYGELRAGAGRSEALRRAQRDMLRGGPHGHPFYWAAFVPIGDEGPLRGV